MDAAATHQQPRRMTALQRLIQTQKDEQQLSFGKIAERAGRRADGAPRLSRSRVQQLAKSPLTRNPEEDTIRGLASGLGVPVDTVRDAVSESLNLLVVRDSTDPELMIYVDELSELDPMRRQRYIRMARALLEEFKK
jgi:transcriptional regulator with XRE-family HTH domain